MVHTIATTQEVEPPLGVCMLRMAVNSKILLEEVPDNHCVFLVLFLSQALPQQSPPR